MSDAIALVRAPKEITHKTTGEVWKLHGLDLGIEPKAIYQDSQGLTWMHSKQVETEFSYAKTEPGNLVPQGKFECGPAGLATLTGHTLFTIKRVLGDLGWCNDRRGVTDQLLREAARALGHDLLFCGKRSIASVLHLMPPCLVSVPSLNYPKAAHGVAWFEGQIVDPNFNRPGRLVYGPEWAPWTIGAYSALVLTKTPLSDKIHNEFKYIRNNGGPDDIKDALLSLRGNT